MQASEIQKALEAKGVPSDKAAPAAIVLAKELRDTTLYRSEEDQAIITAAHQAMSQGVQS